MTDREREIQTTLARLIAHVGEVNPYDTSRKPMMPDDTHGLIAVYFGAEAAASLRFTITYH
jgi:hypothetical protein